MLRFAPSPTGDMHLGNLRVALFNYIVAKQRGEKLVVRIEDTDRERNIEGKDREILEILNLFGIEFSSVSYQSHNLHFHQSFAMKLLTESKAFSCFCTEEILNRKRELAKERKEPFRYDDTCSKLSNIEVLERETEPFVVRLKRPERSIVVKDSIKGEIEFKPYDIDSFVILRVDKTSTYNFACAIDDMLSDISFVIRGEDHLSNTPKQIAIRDAIGYDKELEYAHLPIILGEDGKKMSKRDRYSSVQNLLDEGFLPQAITNYLVVLGNSVEREIFSLDEAVEFFDITSLSKNPAKFDIAKLRFINRKHIELLDNLELSKKFGFYDAELGTLAKLYLEEASTIVELKEKIEKFFSAKEPDDFIEEFNLIREALLKKRDFQRLDELKEYVIEETSLKGKKLFKPLRYILTGSFDGPELGKIFPLIKNYLTEVIK
jgi:glutamyl-tRNA synthetase